jgi:hypothetical protein
MNQNIDEMPSKANSDHTLNNDELVIKGIGRLRYRNAKIALEAAYLSPYHWWWRFLRLSEDYWLTVQYEGRVEDKRLRNMYSDFGDVFSSPFKQWWFERGVELFRERVAPPKVRVVNPISPALTKPLSQYLVLEIPVNLTERTIVAQVRNELKKHENRKIYRQNKSFRPLAKLTGIRSSSFEMAYSAWKLYYLSRDGRTVNRIGQPLGSKSLYQIGKELRLVEKCMPAPGDSSEKSKKKINGMKVATSRMIKRAENLILNAALGDFPVVTAPQDPIVWRTGQKLKLEQAITAGQWQPLFESEESTEES